MAAEVRDKEVFTVEEKRKEKDATPFEEALDLTGIGKYNYTLFTVSTVLLLAMALEIFGTSYVVTASTCDLGLTTKTKGLVAAMPMLGIVLSSHLWGWLADTRGRRFVLLLSMVGSSVFSLCSSLAPAWPALAVFKFMAAFFASAANAVTYALLGECTPRARRNRLVMYLSSGLMFAQAFMSVNAFPVLRMDFDYPITETFRYKPWRMLQQLYAAWSAFSAVLVLVLLKESPKFYASAGRNEDSVRVLAEMFAANTGCPPGEYPVKSVSFQEVNANAKHTNVLRSMWEQTAPLLRPPLLFNTLVITYIVILVYAISPAFLMWTPTIANAYSRAIASDDTVSFCQLLTPHKAADFNTTVVLQTHCVDRVEDLTFITLFAFSTFLAVLNGINSYLIKYISKRSMVVIIHLIGGACGVLLPWVGNIHASVVVFFLFQINLVAMGLTTGFTVEVYPTYLRAMAVCLTMMIGRGASFVVISYVGVLLERHCDAAFWVLGAFVLSGALVGLLLPKEVKTVKKAKPTNA